MMLGSEERSWRPECLGLNCGGGCFAVCARGVFDVWCAAGIYLVCSQAFFSRIFGAVFDLWTFCNSVVRHIVGYRYCPFGGGSSTYVYAYRIINLEHVTINNCCCGCSHINSYMYEGVLGHTKVLEPYYCCRMIRIKFKKKTKFGCLKYKRRRRRTQGEINVQTEPL